MFDFLTKKFSSLLDRIRGKKSTVSLDELIVQVRDTLLEADVPHEVAQDFLDGVARELSSANGPRQDITREQVLAAVHARLLSFLGTESKQSILTGDGIILVLGLQGAGKTTTIAKLARHARVQAERAGKKGVRILCASLDFQRPAAIDQLERVAADAGVDFYRATATDPRVAAREIREYRREEGFNLLFVDTAGRLHVDEALLAELRDVRDALQPRCSVLVLDAMTGQQSLEVAKAFDKAIGFQAAILSKMDSETRAGAAFCFRHVLGKPIAFVGIGERVDDLAPFHPQRVARQMMGGGDLEGLAEQVDERVNRSERENVEQAMLSGKFTFEDMGKQIDMMSQLGPLQRIVRHLPGMGGASLGADEVEHGQREIGQFRAIINSMTQKERCNRHFIDSSRKKRIARGAGVGVEQVDALLQRFEQMKQFAKMVAGGGGNLMDRLRRR